MGYCPIMILMLFCLPLLVDSQMTYQEFLQSTPQQFGLLTVTHARDNDYKYFERHIHIYASMDCPPMTEISVVWNNQISPQEAGIKPNTNWKRPVYYIKTPYNSMDFRYLVPPESTAKVFFSIDDDITVSCTELLRSFEKWKRQAIGDIAPLMTYAPRSFDFNSLESQFTYKDPLGYGLFSIALVGVAWIPRFYLDLYNTDRSREIHELREIVRQKNNCDDIALNFIVNFFFPELVSVALTGQIMLGSPDISQSLGKDHYSFRKECLNKFTEIIGYNPLRLIEINSQKQERYVSSILKQTIYMKKKLLTAEFLSDSKGNPLSSDYFIEVFETAKFKRSEDIYTPEVPQNQPTKNRQDSAQVSRAQNDLRQQVERLKRVIEQLDELQSSDAMMEQYVLQAIPSPTDHSGLLSTLAQVVLILMMGVAAVGIVCLLIVSAKH